MHDDLWHWLEYVFPTARSQAPSNPSPLNCDLMPQALMTYSGPAAPADDDDRDMFGGLPADMTCPQLGLSACLPVCLSIVYSPVKSSRAHTSGRVINVPLLIGTGTGSLAEAPPLLPPRPLVRSIRLANHARAPLPLGWCAFSIISLAPAANAPCANPYACDDKTDLSFKTETSPLSHQLRHSLKSRHLPSQRCDTQSSSLPRLSSSVSAFDTRPRFESAVTPPPNR
jgi:hypothetical protein